MAKKYIIVLVLVVSTFLFLLFCLNNKNTDIVNDMEDKNITNSDDNIEIQNMDKDKEESQVSEIVLEVNNRQLNVKLEDNSSSQALVEKLKENDIIVNAHDYGNFEKVGDLGFNLPKNDKQITTKAGDLILYLGNQLSLYYDTNSWSFTKLGEIENVNGDELKEILGAGNVIIILKKVN